MGAALAAAREIIAQPDWRPVTVAELARKSGIDEATVRDHRAQLERELGVDEATIRRHRAQLESKSPGLFKPARRGWRKRAKAAWARVAELIRGGRRTR